VKTSAAISFVVNKEIEAAGSFEILVAIYITECVTKRKVAI
jgi:hypothetical protein